MTRGSLAMKVVRVSTMLLSTRAQRTRYRLELAAELSDLPPRRRMLHALGFALRTPALRHALTGQEEQPPLHCRWHLYHRYQPTTTDDGYRYSRCVDCGKDDPKVQQPRDDVAWVGFISR